MADGANPLDLSTKDKYQQYILSKAGKTPAKTQGFTQSQIAQQKQQNAADNTIVGGVEQKVAGAVEAVRGIPLLGAVINPALTVAQGIQEKVIDPLAQRVSAVALMDDIQDQGSFVKNWRFAKQQAKKISFGQAVASGIGGTIARAVPSSIENKLPSWMREDFNVFDDTKRAKAFRDEWSGVLVSGLGDLALNAVGSKGTSAMTAAARRAAIGSRTVKLTQAGLEDFRVRVDGAVQEVQAGAPKTSMAKLIDEVVNETRPEVLVTNPLVMSSNNVNRAATLLSEMKDAQSVRNYLLAEKGDINALDNLFNDSPSIHDALTNYGVAKIEPIYDFKEIWKLPDDAGRTRLANVVKDLGKRNPQLAAALEDFAAEKARGVGLNAYQPSRFASLDRLATMRDRVRINASMGEFTPLGKGGWQTKVYQTSAYDRTVRIMQWVGSGRPQGVINITNPRKNEALNDLMSELTSLRMLRNADGDAFRRNIASKWVRAANDTERAKVILEAEEGALRIMADKLGVSGLREVVDGQDAVSRIREYHRELTSRRDSAMEYLKNSDNVMELEDGSIILADAPHLTVRANAAQAVPFLDLGKLELELTSLIRDRAKRGGDYMGVSPVGVAGELSKESARFVAKRAVITAESFLDVANMVFSNLNLLRLAYIPKNSMIDPWVRASMDTESLFNVREMLPATSRAIYNQTRRAQSSWVRVSNRGKVRLLNKEINEISGKDLRPNIIKSQKLTKDIDGIQKQIKDAERLVKQRQRLMYARRDAGDTVGKAKAESAMQEAMDARDASRAALTKAQAELQDAQDAIAAASTIMQKSRDEVYAITSRQYGADAARRRIGEDKWTFDVDGVKYELDGLADPTVKGVNAYLSEIDAFQDFYAATRQSAFSRRLATQRQQWSTINRDKNPDAYFNALAHIANRQLRNDEVARMILEGRSNEYIMNWLIGPTGNKYIRDMSGRWGVPDDMVTSNALEQWVKFTSDRIDKMYPDPRLKQTILERDIATEEVADILAGRQDLLPEIDGPSINMMDINAWEKAAASVERVTNWGWKILSGVETRLVRNPLFLKYTEDSMRRQVRQAKAAGIEVTQDLINNEIRQVAYREAVDRVEQILYSARRQTNGGHIMRYLMAFPTAYFNSQITAARLLAKNPYNAYWYTRVINAGDVFGTYEDRDGNTYTNIQDVPKGTAVSIKLPIYSENVPDWLAPYFDKRGGGIKLNPKQLEFMVGDPSVSFFGSMSVSNLMMATAKNSVFGVYGEDIANFLRGTFGDDVYESAILYGGYPASGDTVTQRVADAILPAYLRSFMSALSGKTGDETGFMGDTQFSSSVAANYRTAVANWAKNGRVGDAPDVGNSIKATATLYFFRTLLQFSMPISTSFDPVTAAMTRYYGDAVDANGGDFQKAEDQIVKAFGVDALALIGSSSKNRAGFASTMDDIKILRKNQTLMKRIFQATGKMELAGMLSSGYSDIADNYSTEVAALYRNMDFPGTGMDLVKIRDAEQLMKDPQVRMGWYEWSKAVDWRDSMMEQYGIKSTYEKRYKALGLSAEMKRIENELNKAYPLWASERNAARADFRKGTLNALNVITADKNWMSAQPNDKWDEISVWADSATRFYQKYDELTTSGQDTRWLRESFSAWHHNYVKNGSTEFGMFASRWLSNMKELIDEEEMTANG